MLRQAIDATKRSRIQENYDDTYSTAESLDHFGDRINRYVNRHLDLGSVAESDNSANIPPCGPINKTYADTFVFQRSSERKCIPRQDLEAGSILYRSVHAIGKGAWQKQHYGVFLDLSDARSTLPRRHPLTGSGKQLASTPQEEKP
ncbi:MAG: hypothetical protein MK165_06860 [Pirellulaceae bacterium]|nr:hypothetical protein [Pirellulaceae bacterium]